MPLVDLSGTFDGEEPEELSDFTHVRALRRSFVLVLDHTHPTEK